MNEDRPYIVTVRMPPGSQMRVADFIMDQQREAILSARAARASTSQAKANYSMNKILIRMISILLLPDLSEAARVEGCSVDQFIHRATKERMDQYTEEGSSDQS